MSHQSAAAGAKSDGRRRRSSKAKTKPPVTVERQWSEPPQYDLAVSGGQVRRGRLGGEAAAWGEGKQKRPPFPVSALWRNVLYIYSKTTKGKPYNTSQITRISPFSILSLSLSVGIEIPLSLSLSLSSLGKRMRERDKSPNAPYAPSLGYSILGSSFGE